MPLFSWQRPKDGEGENEIKVTISSEDQKKIDDAAKAASELPAIKQQLEGLKSIQAFVDEYKRDKADAAAAAAKKTQQQTQTEADEEIEALMLTDPKQAILKATTPQAIAIMTLRADNIRREVFEDTEKYKYYHGDIKKEVDALLAAQKLDARNDPSVVENCYLTVLGKHNDEILEGKIKTRFAGSESSSRGTSSGNAGNTDAAEKKNRIIPDDVKRAAKQFGITPEDYADMLDKEGIGYA